MGLLFQVAEFVRHGALMHGDFVSLVHVQHSTIT